jgi:hypothetical protein
MYDPFVLTRTTPYRLEPRAHLAAKIRRQRRRSLHR